MIGSDIEQYGDVGFKFGHPIELKTAKFHHVIIMFFFGHLQCQAFSHIAGQTHIESAIFQNMVYQHGSRCFAIAPGDTYHFGIGVSSCKFNFGNNGCVLCFQFLYYWCLVGYSGTFYNFISI